MGFEDLAGVHRLGSPLPYPELELEYECVALHHPHEYAVMSGDDWSFKGHRIRIVVHENAYEEHVRRSNALHGHISDGGTYLVGPLARLNLNHQQLLPVAHRALQPAHVEFLLKNPYKSLIARSTELVQFFGEAIEIVSAYRPSLPAHVDFELRAVEDAGATEAPRALLCHRYEIDANGLVQFAKIVPPTAENLPRLETDLLALAPRLVTMSESQATRAAEDLLRAYDACISCATDFLRMSVVEVA